MISNASTELATQENFYVNYSQKIPHMMDNL
jgi:hypothetical protein